MLTRRTGFLQTIAERVKADDRDPTVIAELKSHIASLPLGSSSAVKAKRDEFDRAGTDLWNLATRLRRDGNDADNVTLTLLRVFAFLVLDSAHQESRPTSQSCVRLLRVALKAAKHCIDGAQSDLCTRLMERAAYYESQLEKRKNDHPEEDGLLHQRLKAEYFILRTTLVCGVPSLDHRNHY